VLLSLIAVAEPSKTPFLIAGGVLALWAVVLAGIGITRPTFPGGTGGARGVMTISFALVALTIAMAVVSSK
jgi:hypothetical protein